MSAAIRLKGEGRIRIVDERVVEEARRMHPDWPLFEREQLIWGRGDIDVDTGWQTNTITDQARQAIAAEASFGVGLDMWIAQNKTPSNVLTNILGNLYASQTPLQIKTPDSSVFDTDALLQTRTVQFTAPSVARDINTTGLTTATGVSAPQGIIYGILAITLLSSTVVQGTTQAADVQYRVTFSLDF